MQYEQVHGQYDHVNEQSYERMSPNNIFKNNGVSIDNNNNNIAVVIQEKKIINTFQAMQGQAFPATPCAIRILDNLKNSKNSCVNIINTS